jgi:hypothetical protein
MSYASVDGEIRAWADRHSLKLHTTWAGREIRSAYVSSKAGECFQIWVDPPVNGQFVVHAACVEGRREDEAPRDWHAAATGLQATLDTVFQAVLGWMAPSERFLPETRH